MQQLKRIISTLARALFFAFLVLNFNACTEQSPMQPTASEDNSTMLAKGRKGRPITFPISNTKLFEYKGSYDWYEDGNLHLGNGTQNKLSVEEGALTPPPLHPWGQDVMISMEVDYDDTKNELVFTFGPHGCQFSPSARIIMDYSKLGIKVGKLYYIDDNGDYIPQSPAQLDVKGKNMTIYVNHFSRYAIGAE